jgi:phage repressor protein C with HTH and peptisase S24 domain
MSLGERIKTARENAGLTQVKLAEALGVSRGAVANWEKKNPNNPETDRLRDIANILKVSPSWLLQGGSEDLAVSLDKRPRSGQGQDEAQTPPQYGTMDLAMGRPNFEETPLPSRADQQHKIKELGLAEAGKDGVFYLNGETVDYHARPPGLAHRMQVYTIRVQGSSMVPIYYDGDLLFVDAARKPFPERDAVIELHPTEEGGPMLAFIKRVVSINSEFVELKEWQPKERTFKVARSKIRSLHLVLKNNDMY